MTRLARRNKTKRIKLLKSRKPRWVWDDDHLATPAMRKRRRILVKNVLNPSLNQFLKAAGVTP